VLLLIDYDITDLQIYSAALFLKQQCDRALVGKGHGRVREQSGVLAQSISEWIAGWLAPAPPCGSAPQKLFLGSQEMWCIRKLCGKYLWEVLVMGSF
jgi:hypothetical protein